MESVSKVLRRRLQQMYAIPINMNNLIIYRDGVKPNTELFSHKLSLDKTNVISLVFDAILSGHLDLWFSEIIFSKKKYI